MENNNSNLLMTVIVPCFNEEEALPIFYDEIVKVSKKLSDRINMEIILVDDGSTDNTLDIMKKLNKQDSMIRYISFSRNFGKESAMYAGLEHSNGEYVAIMDVDLQDPPELLEDMLDGIQNEGYDCVASRRVTRKGEPPIRSFFARMFYKMINKISKVEIVDGARDFRLMTRKMVNALLSVKEKNRFSKGLFSWVGFETKWLEYENKERSAGETKWSFWKLLLYSLDGIVAFSTAPLAISSFIGVIFFLVFIIIIIFIIIRKLVFGDPVSGWPSLVCIIFFVSGLQMFTVGILGQYLAKTYLEVKERPIYIIGEQSSNSKKGK